MSEISRNFKDKAYKQLARVGKSVSSPRRIELLDLLTQAPRSVAELAELASLSVANTSQHLQTLREARLVDTKREGNHIIYCLASDEVGEFIISLRRLAEGRLAELRAVEDDFFDDDEVDAEDIWKRIEDKKAAIVDVRPPPEFEAGHIAGAISIPIEDFPTRLTELSKDQDIVVYCRGPFCTFAADAVRLLRKKGYDAVRLRDSYAEWRARRFDEKTGT